MSEVVFIIRSPIKLVIGLAVITAWLCLIAPLDFVVSGDALTIALALLLPTIFMLGLLLGFRRFETVSVPIQLNIRRLRRVFSLICVLGVIGLGLRMYERIVLRLGGTVSANFIENRLLVESGGSNLISLVSGLLVSSFLFLPLFYFLHCKLGCASWQHKVLLVVSFLYPLSDIMLQGSRSTLVVYLAVLTVSWLTLNRFRFSLRSIAILTMMAGGILFLFSWVFYLRTSQMGLEPVASMHLSGYAHFTPAKVSVIQYLEQSGASVIAFFVYASVHVLQYMLHGIFEFLYVLSQVTDAKSYGAQTFYIPMKMLESLTGIPDLESIIGEVVLRTGVFTTLFGPFVYDYGIFGAFVFCFLFAFLIGAVARGLRHGQTHLLPLYIVFSGLIPFSYIFNVYVSASGQYALITSVFFLLILLSRKFRLDL